MKSKLTLPDWLSIVRLEGDRYQLIDVSKASIGLSLRIFPSRETAEALAERIAQSKIFKPISFFSAAGRRTWKSACAIAASLAFENPRTH